MTNYANALILAEETTSGHSEPPILSAEEMWNIDTKVDDAKPGLGSLVTLEA